MKCSFHRDYLLKDQLAFDNVRTFIFLLFRFFFLDGLFKQSLHGKTDTAFFIHFQYLNADNLTFLQIIANLVDTLMGDLANMKQSVSSRQYLNNGAKIEKFLDCALDRKSVV